MSTQNNNWIDKVKKELNEYTPVYNDSDWKALESKLPAPKGWIGLPKQLIKWLKVIFIASVTITAIVLLTKPETENTNSGKVIQTENTETAEQIPATTDEEKTGLKNDINAVEIINSESVATPLTNPVSSQNKSTKKVVTSNQSSGQQSESKKTELVSEPVKDDSNQNFKVLEKSGLSAGIDISTLILPDSSGISPQIIQNKVPENQQVLANDISEKPNQDYQQINNQQEQQGNIKKGNKKLFKEPLMYIPKTPFLIGATYAVSFETGMAPYQSKINALNGGLVFEKFLSEKSSVAFKPQIHTKNFYDNEIIQISDTVAGTATPNDSLGNPSGKPEIIVSESEVTHTLDWMYLDFPLIYTRYFVIRDKYRLAISAGISNKYYLSLKNDGNSVSLDQSFYLAQSGLISFKYQKVWNKNLFLEAEPFVSVPFRKISDENFQWTSFGLNVSLLFDISKK
ncbi:MAG TPA: hypothetical protein VLQ91_13640 [Draconibacterium sp.]|nr:hypothetical protein [Draconibacterium sp.]